MTQPMQDMKQTDACQRAMHRKYEGCSMNQTCMCMLLTYRYMPRQCALADSDLLWTC